MPITTFSNCLQIICLPETDAFLYTLLTGPLKFACHDRLQLPSKLKPEKIVDEGLDTESLKRGYAEALELYEREARRSETIEHKAQALNVFVGVVASLTATILSSKVNADAHLPMIGFLIMGMALLLAVLSLLNAMAVVTPTRFAVMQPAARDVINFVRLDKDKHLLTRINDLLHSIENNSYVNRAKAEFLSRAQWFSCFSIILLLFASGIFIFNLCRSGPPPETKALPISVQCFAPDSDSNKPNTPVSRVRKLKAGADNCLCPPANKPIGQIGK